MIIVFKERIRRCDPVCYLHPAQDEDEHPPQPEPDGDDEDPPEPFPIPNFDSRLTVSFELHEGQRTSGFWPKTSFSKQH
jgi:hypothetical protein